jgi:hypothetical protein
MLAFHHIGRFDRFNYNSAMEQLFTSLRHPFREIRTYGIANFINDEFFPFAPLRTNGSFVPNIMLHVLGGGYTFAWMEEYYRYHGFEHPMLAAAATAYVKNFLNELVETPPERMTWVDPISDLFFWDVAALALFSRTEVRTFFTETIGLYQWNTMPVLLPTTQFANTNAFFVFRPVQLSWRVKPILISGLGGLAGFSIPISNSANFSVAAGFLSDEVIFGPPGTAEPPALIAKPALGLYYDRNNSLLGSLLLKASNQISWRVNVYPGLIHGGAGRFGFYAENRGTFHAGIAFRITGFGIGI